MDKAKVFLENGHVANSNNALIEGAVYPIGTEVELACNRNNKLIGSKKFVCMQDGNWNQDWPECKIGRPK
jgi:hypothetical protein